MPITLPNIDDRRFEDLLSETLARIPVHTPEWTNFNRSDPGVTLIELHAYLVETLLYRCNLIPARNRNKFLQLLQIPLNPAEAARGIIQFANKSGTNETLTVVHASRVSAGSVPFNTEQGLEVLPVESMLFSKREVKKPSVELTDYYQQLYASYRDQPPLTKLKLYETLPFPFAGGGVMDVTQDSVDQSLWLALLTRPADGQGENVRERAREALANKTLSFGIVPDVSNNSLTLPVYRSSSAEAEEALKFYTPNVPADGKLPQDEKLRDGSYRLLNAVPNVNTLREPGVVQVTLPGKEGLRVWTDLDPIESGTRDLPPSIDDTNIADRLITWIKIRFPEQSNARLRWAGINAAMVKQRRSIKNERLRNANGEPDQEYNLANQPVIAGSVKVRIDTSVSNGSLRSEQWEYIDDLLSAPAEVPRYDPQLSKLSSQNNNTESRVFTVDEEAGRIRFGDGLHGMRPAAESRIFVDYDVSLGQEGNVGSESINSGVNLIPGVTVSNPVATWGGADAEDISSAEKLIPSYLSHRDRLVSMDDYITIVKRTPGLDIARVEGLATYNPDLPGSVPGDSPGAITILILPRIDSVNPEAPQPDALFLDSVCRYIDPRRLVTTEVFLRGPTYIPVWVSVGITVKAGESIAEVRDRVEQRLRRFMSPLPAKLILPTNLNAGDDPGWPLNTPLVAAELLAEASRDPAVQRINGLHLADADGNEKTEILMSGLELPRILGITVSIGDPLNISELNGEGGDGGDGNGNGNGSTRIDDNFVPVPIVPGEC